MEIDMIRTKSAPFLLDGPVSQFVAKIRHIGMLEAQREYAIVKRWREHGDRKAERLLIASQLRLVAKIAWGYRAYGISFSKLICEGNIGLMEAVKRFDPDHGIRLATYSTWQIHAAILHHSLQRVHTAAEYKKLLFDLRRLETRLTAISEDGDATDGMKDIRADWRKWTPIERLTAWVFRGGDEQHSHSLAAGDR
jgi:RNA polymerase sigma-32 factor